jgi:hypothetical protein
MNIKLAEEYTFVLGEYSKLITSLCHIIDSSVDLGLRAPNSLIIDAMQESLARMNKRKESLERGEKDESQ